MKRTKWFERSFSIISDNGLLPGIIERLVGTPARLTEKLQKTPPHLLNFTPAGKWSIKKEIGHLIDLEPLWLGRVTEIIDGQQELREADLSNKLTHETNHDDRDIYDLMMDFKKQRQELVGLIQGVEDSVLEQSAKHPRLGTPMRLIDLAFFIAEHDDHHLAQITYMQNQENQ